MHPINLPLQPSIQTSQTLFKGIYQAILPAIEDPRECKAITQRILEVCFGCNSIGLVCNQPIEVSLAASEHLNQLIQRIQQHEPIQYLLGYAPFLGRDFYVTPAVLIPRPETEELVTAILQENSASNLSILDIGTGSGCIAITLKKAWPTAQIDALEVSPQALEIAVANAQRWGTSIHWILGDLFQDSLPDQQWDIIVSNPPYVRLSERKWMHQRVLDYEPSQALFVSDAQPLVFYKRIIELAPKHLKPGGKLYLEINEAFGEALAQLLRLAGFYLIQVHQDLSGKDRWVSARCAIKS